MATQARERGVLVLTYITLAALGLLSGVIEAFLVPQRLAGGVEGLSIALALVGNVLIGTLGGVGTRTFAGAVVPVLTWFVGVGFFTLTGPGGDVVIPGALPNDPGITYVSNGLLVVGVLGSAIAMVVTARYTKRANPPTERS